MDYGSFEKNGVTVPTAEVVVQELILLGAPFNGSAASDDDDSSE